MITHLLPCPGCGRHVRRSEPSCPFCGASVSALATSAPVRATPGVRLGRAATFAFGAALGSQVAGCPAPAPTPGTDAGPPAADAPVVVDDTGLGDDGGPAPLYGGPADVGPTPDDAGMAEDTGGPAPAYGGPADAGDPDAGGVAPLYGGAP